MTELMRSDASLTLKSALLALLKGASYRLASLPAPKPQHIFKTPSLQTARQAVKVHQRTDGHVRERKTKGINQTACAVMARSHKRKANGGLAFLNITPQSGRSASASPLPAPGRHGERRYEAGTSGRNNGACLHWQSLALFSLGSG